eukprot:4608440-Amphidinium_carterae.1
MLGISIFGLVGLTRNLDSSIIQAVSLAGTASNCASRHRSDDTECRVLNAGVRYRATCRSWAIPARKRRWTMSDQIVVLTDVLAHLAP